MRVFLTACSEFHMEKTVHPLHYYPPSFMVWGFMLYSLYALIASHHLMFVTLPFTLLASPHWLFLTLPFTLFAYPHSLLVTLSFTLLASPHWLFVTSPFTLFASPHSLFLTLPFTIFAYPHSFHHDSSLACREISIENICACGRVK